MEIFYTVKFSREAKKLPLSLRPVVEERLAIFKLDHFDPKLKTHKLSGALEGYWSFSITHKVRIIFRFDGPKTALFHSIGDHSIYV